MLILVFHMSYIAGKHQPKRNGSKLSLYKITKSYLQMKTNFDASSTIKAASWKNAAKSLEIQVFMKPFSISIMGKVVKFLG